MNKLKALPIGLSSIQDVIATGYYVDKTSYAQTLIERGNPIFITRPRRFGKSLFIDTLAAICSGERELFKGYHIGKPENGYERNYMRFPTIAITLNAYLNFNHYAERKL